MRNRLALLILFGLGILVGISVRPMMPTAQAQEPPPRATITPTGSADMPDRPTLTPTPSPLAQPDATNAEESRAQIILLAGTEHDGHWAIVEWQDRQGDWHDVTGWQGHVSQGQISWRVLPKDFDKGPYRWVLYDQPNGSEICSSKNFYLPSDWLGQVNVELSDCAQPAAQVNIASLSSSPVPGTGSESLYVLRVHRLDNGSVQISVHNIDTYETWHFTSFENLLEYIESKNE
jgi:hypothetical protein